MDNKQLNKSFWVSDAIAELLRALELPYVCLVPGASFRGLHDSLVNHLGVRDPSTSLRASPQMLVCLHEEHAVAIAHGYAKVTGKPLGVIVHANVGLMHAVMAIFNAWCDRMPVIILGATGAVDAAKRRPWIEWIHTAKDQGALVRNFVKWDDQPASVQAAQESLLRAAQIATTAPRGPVYVCLDTDLQETKLDAMPCLPDVARFRAPAPARPAPEQITRAADLLCAAKNPVILMGRVLRDENAWRTRVAFAEALGAVVLTDLKVGAAFPTDHPLHRAPPETRLSPAAEAVLRNADVILSLDWVDLAGTLKAAWGAEQVGAKIIHVSVDQYTHNGWSMDYQGLPPTDLYLMCEPDATVPPLLDAIRGRDTSLRGAILSERSESKDATKQSPKPNAETVSTASVASQSVAPLAGKTLATLAPPARAGVIDGITLAHIAQTLQQILAGEKTSFVHPPLGWSGELMHFRHPLDYLGKDGGAGIGAGPGISVGAALALKNSGRLPVAVLGDGDFLMGLTAFWTAANARIPMLVIVANNNAYMNDVQHQERVAKERGRPIENKWIGQRLTDPAPDLAMLARGQGLEGIGPIEKPEALAAALRDAVAIVKQGKACVVDVRVAH